VLRASGSTSARSTLAPAEARPLPERPSNGANADTAAAGWAEASGETIEALKSEVMAGTFQA
jgi:hypothetical protein